MAHATAQLTLLLSSLLVIIPAVDRRPQPQNAATLRPEQWRQDLQSLATELPRRHKNLFFKTPREEFDRAVAELDAAIPAKADHEIVVGLMRITALVGDAHTSLSFPGGSSAFRRYPLRLAWFRDGIYVTHVTAATFPSPRGLRGYRRALGARLVQVGETAIEQVVAAVSTVISHENEAWLREQSPSYLVIPEVLNALGVLPDMERGRFVFEDFSGQRLSLEFAPVSRSEPIEWLQAPPWTRVPLPLYRQKPDVFYWYRYLDDSQTLYFQYNRCANAPDLPFSTFAQELLAFLDTHPVARFVIDLRQNPGGNSSIISPLISGLRSRTAINQRGHLFVIIGQGTFSSGVNNTIDLRNQTNAIFFGGPTGGKPNSYGELGSFVLPNSGLTCFYSTKFFQLVPGDPPSVFPDITVELSSDDYLTGRDPVLEAILAD